MPCYTVRTIKVAFEVADQDILLRGLKAAGFTISQGRNELIVTRGTAVAVIAKGQIKTVVESVIGEIKRAYATETVRTAATRYGWLLQQDRMNSRRFVAQRR